MMFLQSSKNAKPYINFRWMIRREMPRIAEIEAQCFEKPWTEGELCVCFNSSEVIGMVVEIDEIVAGYMLYRRHPTRFELMKIAVVPEYRRKGVASLLVAKLVDKIPQFSNAFDKADGLIRNRVTTLVPESNYAAHCLLRKHNFRAISVLRDHYQNPTEDAYLFQRSSDW